MSKYTVTLTTDRAVMDVVEKQLIDNLTIFQQLTWLDTVGGCPQAIICTDEHGIVKGYFPFIKTTKYKIKSLHIPPYTPYFGPVITETDLAKKMDVVDLVLQKLKGEGHLDFLLRLNDQDILPFIKSGFTIEARQTHVLTNSSNFGAENIHSSKRRYLKKLIASLESGEIILKRGKEAVPDLLQLNHVTQERASFKGKDQVLEKLIAADVAPEKSVLVLYDDKGTALAGAFYPRDKYSAYHLINASRRNENSLLDKANILSTYLAIKSSFADGLNFDFEGSNIPGVANFYRMMGGKPVVNYRLQKTRSVFYQCLRLAQQFRKERNG